ncbi:hypothetical protein OKW40_001962 [Paraburkholderia sp. RAU6.4a]|uniref:hypothetical protein n=1 Tax=Paraburkholderia sp. RAU6.4a TaxID=2991067 RepID=UPI003D1E5DFB
MRATDIAGDRQVSCIAMLEPVRQRLWQKSTLMVCALSAFWKIRRGLMEQQIQEGTGGKEECQLCRITYSIYSNFPRMPSAMALNAETGEWFPFDRLKSYSNGYDMAEALGYAWACDCRERTPKRFNEQFELRDSTGKRQTGVRYRIRVGSRVIAKGVTDSQGRTQRVSTDNAKQVSIEVDGP